jgi:hypothetical protein
MNADKGTPIAADKNVDLELCNVQQISVMPVPIHASPIICVHRRALIGVHRRFQRFAVGSLEGARTQNWAPAYAR